MKKYKFTEKIVILHDFVNGIEKYEKRNVCQ